MSELELACLGNGVSFVNSVPPKSGKNKWQLQIPKSAPAFLAE